MPGKVKWDELPCPDCLEPASAFAARCPHCTLAFSSDQIAARRREFKQKLWFIGVGTLLLIGLILWLDP